MSLADGTMDVLAIEGEEEFDITGTLAPVYTFAPALLRRVIDDGSYLSKSWRSTLADGFTPYAENVAPNGKRRAMTWHATFPGGLNAKGALTSGAGLPVANFNSAATGLALARKQTAYDSVWGDCDSCICWICGSCAISTLKTAVFWKAAPTTICSIKLQPPKPA